jgi:hypothetical protein
VFVANFVAAAIFARKLVPGWIYDRLAEDWRVLKDQGDRNAKSLEAIPGLTVSMADMGARMRGLEAAVADLAREHDRSARRDR